MVEVIMIFLFGRKKEVKKEFVPPLPEESKKLKKPKKMKPKMKPRKIVMGVAPALMQDVKARVRAIKAERDELRMRSEELEDKYEDALNRLGVVEGKCKAVENSFNSFKDDLMTDFMEEARKVLKKEMKLQGDAVTATYRRVLRIEDDLMNINKDFDDLKFTTSFSDYYHLIKCLIFFMTNCESSDHRLITISLQTIRSIISDMRANGYWKSGKDAIITSLLNLKAYWRSKDERVENLIGVEVDALESLR